MEIAKIEIDKTTGICISRRRIPAGIVGATVSVVFKDPVWDDFMKTVVFRSNGSRIAEFDGTVAVIPGDIVAKPGVRLHFGIWGHNPKTGMQLPLIEIPIGITEKATDPQADPGVDPGLPIWAQLQQDIEELKNAGVGKPGEKGEQGDPGEDGGWYTPAVTQPDKNTIKFAFTPSKDGMPAVEPGFVELPDSGENIEEHNTDPTSHADIRKRLTAANIVESAIGDVIAVSDSSDMELAGLRVFGKTTQNGTPTPDAPVPLKSVGDSGSVTATVCGKNLLNAVFDYTAAFVPYVSYGTDKSVTVNNTSSNLVYPKTKPTIFPAGTYTFSIVLVNGVYSNLFIQYADHDYNVFLSGSTLKRTITFTEDTSVNLMFGVGVGNTTTYRIQIEKGSTATAYEPYNGQTHSIATPLGLPGIPVTSGGNYTDEDGQQWVCDEVDFEKGVYVQRMRCERLTRNFNWTASASLNSRFNINMRVKEKVPPICTHFIGMIGVSSEIGYVSNNVGVQICFATKFSSLEDWLAWVDANEAYVMYALAEENNIPLSTDQIAAFAALHTVYPNTTVFNDAGAGMEVQYVADTKLYIDKKFAELAQAMLSQ